MAIRFRAFAAMLIETVYLDATHKLAGEGFKRPWPPLIKMDAAVKAKVEKLFGLR
jgi:3-polyprenyl-4-hydroxybenzoate decarboxylase